MTTENDADTVTIPGPGAAPGESRPEPVSAGVRVAVGGLSHPGKVRPNNEDHFLALRFGRFLDTLATNLPAGDVPDRFEEVGYALAVADGMGGAAAGEVASRMAITVALNLALEHPKWHLVTNPEEDAVRVATWQERFHQIDAVLARRAVGDPALSGMATTLTIACSVGTHLFLYHVGDSRAYLFRRGGLHRLTSDHTVAQALADAGQIAPADVAGHHYRHALTRFIGRGTDPEAEILHLRLADGDRLLLCSDGLTEMVPDDRIAAALRTTPGPDAAGQLLVALALDAGGRDNVTAVIADYTVPGPPPP